MEGRVARQKEDDGRDSDVGQSYWRGSPLQGIAPKTELGVLFPQPHLTFS